MTLYHIVNLTHPNSSSILARYCDGFWSKFTGYMFHKPINTSESIILAENHESIMDTSIHMFFMRFDLGVIWLDGSKKVVDKVLARKWRPYYAPKSKAQYVIEAHPTRLSDFNIDDQVNFEA